MFGSTARTLRTWYPDPQTHSLQNLQGRFEFLDSSSRVLRVDWIYGCFSVEPII